MNPSHDPFELLGLPPRFGLEPDELDRRQRELTLARRADGPGALEALNHAVRVLRDPITRAERLFMLRGWSLRGVADPQLLEQVFAEREQLDAWRRARDVEALRHWIRELATPRQRELSERLGAVLDPVPPGSGESGSSERATATSSVAEDSIQALRLLERLRYGARALATARSAVDELET